MPRALEISVLGPVTVTADGDASDLMPALRTLLSALVVDAPRVVSSETLRSRLWDDDWLEGSATTLHSYVSRLRNRLGREALVTQAPGYRLEVPPEAVDAVRFTALLREAREQQDAATARDRVRTAVGLWRGEAYADVPQRFARVEAARLGEQLLEAHELGAHLDLRLGRHHAVVDRLSALVEKEPLRESMRAALMVALYRCGRQAAALEVYEQGRHHLAEELGVDPGPALRRLHEQVLRQDPELDAPTPPPAAAADATPAGTSGASPAPAPTPAPVAPASSAPPVVRTGLIAPPTSLVGRDELVVEIAESLTSGSRLVTLTGPGGVGKTRLAVAVVAEVRPYFTDGVLMLPLATVQDPQLVVPAITYALDRMLAELAPTEEAGPPTGDPRTDLAHRLRGRRVLLVLDNVEHLLDAASDVAWLVAAAPGLSVLSTSRAPLRVTGEEERLVEPLPVPAPTRGSGASPARVAEAPAVALFVSRAQAVSRGFVLDEQNASAVAEICRRLSGIPLAIELAAARVRLLGPAALLDRLDESLTAGPRDLPERQRTMQATLDWSYRLLDEPAQRLFRLLAVFSGGWTLDLLAAVAGPDALLPLEDLVEQSLVTVTWSPEGLPRYAMLEPTRQHARRLAGPDELARAADAHAAACLELAERANPGYLARDQVHWLGVMDGEHANVLAAFDHCVASGDHETAARLTWALWAYWFLRALSAVGRRICAVAVALPGVSEVVRGRALVAYATTCWSMGDKADAGEHWTASLAIADAEGDLLSQGNSHAGLGIVALSSLDLATAEHHHRRAIEVAEELSDAPGPDAPYAPWIIALNRVWLGTALMASGRVEESREHFDAGLRLAQERGDRLATFVALWNLARIEAASDPESARARLRSGIGYAYEVGYFSNLAYFLDALVVLDLRRQGEDADLVRLATLLGAAEAARPLGGGPGFGSYYLPDDEARDVAGAEIAEHLGRVPYDECRRTGRLLDVDEVLDLVGR